MLVRFAVSFLLLLPLSFAQSQNRYKVSGTVVNAVTGAPIGRALVAMNGTTNAQVFSDANGKFEFATVPEGQAFLNAQRPGFFGSNAPPQRVTVNAATPNVTLKLTPGGTIRGRVMSNDGEPLEAVQVQVMRRGVNGGIRMWMPMNMATTDETGSYAFEDLMAGTYLLRTMPHPMFRAGADLVINGQHLPELYPASYFPNAPDRASAQPVTLQPGGEANADFSLTAVPAYKIRGTIAGERSYAAACENADGDAIAQNFRVDQRTHQFLMTGVPAGMCRLFARSFGRDGLSGYGEQMVNVTADIEGVQLSVNMMAEIPVVVTGQAPGSGMPVNLIVMPKAPKLHMPNIFVTTRSGENGAQELVIRNPLPGSYRVSAQGTQAGTCVASVTSGGTDLLREELTISADSPPQPVTVTLRSDCGTITGKIEGASTGVMSWVLIVGGGTLPHLRNVMGENFTIPNLTPGDYTLYAFANGQELEYANPDVMKNFSGQQITVGANEKATIQLKLQDANGGTQ